MRIGSCLVFTTVLIATYPVPAQNPDAAKSTGKEGQLIPDTFPCFSINGPRPKRVQCFFDEHGLNPTVAIIAMKAPEKPSEPLAGLLQKLEVRAAENKAAYFGAFAIFLNMEKPLSDDPTGGDQFGALEGLVSQLKLKEVTVGMDTKDSPKLATFGIDKEKDEVTVLVYSQHKVDRRFTFTKDKPLTDKDVGEIVAAAEKIIPKKKK